MAKTTEKTNAERREEPWRKGRPSFKAFYPELILLTAITIAFIAFGARLSCAEVKKTPSTDAAPPSVSSATPFLTAEAFAQDVSLDDADPVAAPVEADADPVAAPVEADADPVAAPVEADADPVAAPVEADADPVAAPVEADADPVAAPVEADAEPVAKKSSALKYYIIWGFCLLIPAALWVWRALVWLTSVYGVYYEIRTDEDNPKATTILVRRGIINKKTDSMHIAQVKDIQTTQSIWQKYFQGGVGTIRLFTKDLTDDVLVMKNMEEPSRVFNALDELRRRYWALGGIGGFNGQGGTGVEADELDSAAM